MPSRKKRNRARRRVMGLLAEAWESVEAGRTALAEKLARRAIDEGGFVNPRVWLDHGRILWRCGHRAEGEEAVRRALSLVPGYAAAAAALLEMSGTTRALDEAEPADASRAPDGAADGALERPPEFTARTDRYDWDDVESRLRERGAATLPGLLERRECAAVAAWFDDDELFEHIGSLDDDELGRVEVRALSSPLPALVADLRAELYGRAAVIARRFDELVGAAPRWPACSAAFLARCDRAGCRRSAVSLLRLREGGFVGLRRDDGGAGWFPLRLLVALGGDRAADAAGARAGVELGILDLRHGKRRRPRAVAIAPGDGVLFPDRERPVRVGGVYGLQSVAYGIALASAPHAASARHAASAPHAAAAPPAGSRVLLEVGFGAV